MSDDAQIAALAAGLTPCDVKTLLGARPADCGEYWTTRAVGDSRLAGSDQVLTELGTRVRHHLEQERAK